MSKEEKRIDIIKAATKIFSLNGIHQTKMEDIAKEAGVGKGTIYEYFESKKELFREMIRYSVMQYRNKVVENFLKNEPLRDKLINLCLSHDRFVKEHINMALAVLSQTEMLSQETRGWIIEYMDELQELVMSALKKDVETGQLRADLDLEIATHAIFGTISQFYSRRILCENGKYDDIDPKPLVDTLLRGFR